MNSEVKKADWILCQKCSGQLLTIEGKVFCQICRNPDGNFKQIKPR